jgi:hypothetical protein
MDICIADPQVWILLVLNNKWGQERPEGTRAAATSLSPAKPFPSTPDWSAALVEVFDAPPEL